MKKVFTKKWFKAAGVRAVKTMAQTFVATAGTSTLITEVDWLVVGSATVMAGILSMATSVAGIPELNEGDVTIDTFEELSDGKGEDDEQ